MHRISMPCQGYRNAILDFKPAFIFILTGKSKFTLIDSTLCVMILPWNHAQTHLYRMTETDCERVSDFVPPYLPFEMWLTIMSFVQVVIYFEVQLVSIRTCSVLCSSTLNRDLTLL